MAEVSDNTKFMMRHALGFNQSPGRTQSYRNHYVTGPGTTRHNEWLALVEKGLAEMYPVQQDDHFIAFGLTRAGAEAALNKNETLCPEDFPS